MWGVKTFSILSLFSTTLSINPCTLNYDAGPCKGLKHVVAFENGKCVSKLYGGCKGNANRFNSIQECESTCAISLTKKFTPKNPICLVPAVSTEASKKCRGIFPRFTFNSEAGQCQEIVYGGCGASANLFVTLEDCIGVCMTETETKESTISFPDENSDEDEEFSEEDDSDDDNENICDLPPITPGLLSCMAFIPKWTFSKSEGKCVSYMYGGCRGTKNLFDSEAECKAECANKNSRSTKTAEVCSLPNYTGLYCTSIPIQTFGFNSETGRCELGGCKGNGNTFETLEECVNTCGGMTEPLTTNKCDDVKCDRAQQQMKESQGCTPITKPGDCCPSSWDCSAWEERLNHKQKCWYKGQYYEAGQSIEVEESCKVGCFCEINQDGLATITCALTDCFPPPSVDKNETCHPQYSSLNQCCPSKFNCGRELDFLMQCYHYDTPYYEGEIMQARPSDRYVHDPCFKCLCQEGWDGDLGGQFCTRINDDLNLDGDKLLRGCKPLYEQGVCSHTGWVCPDDVQQGSLTSEPSKTAIKADDKCLLPKEVGPCKMNKDMFYFDVGTRKCTSFKYGGCKGNENQFSTIEDCKSVCKEYMPEKEASSVCQQPKASGRCRGFQKKFYFNSNSGGCDEFVYTGCQGNENRFDSLDECETTCSSQDRSSDLIASKNANICEQPVLIGRCKSRMEKYYFDKNTGRCNKFYYSGCGGGSNMFDTSAECQDSCVQPAQLKRASVLQDLFLSNPCHQEKDPGPCRAAKPRFYFDKTSKKCQPFLYGGCKGNDNNFPDQEACEKKCSARTLPQPIDVSTFNTPFVTLPQPAKPPQAPGSGFGPSCPGCHSKVDVTHDIKMIAAHGVKKLVDVNSVGGAECGKVVLKKIEDVTHQVVAGSNYKFSMVVEVKTGLYCDVKKEQKCSSVTLHKPLSCKIDNYAKCLQLLYPEKIRCNDNSVQASDEEFDPCFLEKQVGRCRASFNRWYFDAATRTCQMFRYGGCMGNKNNFASANACEAQCAKHMTKTPRVLRPTPVNPVCQLPMEAGPCYALKPRYFFNFESRRCEQFIYGGCRGNANNFGTIEECISSCGKHPRGIGLPLIEPPKEERCVFGNNTFAVGDILRVPDEECTSCVCNSPPDMSCFKTKCPVRAFLPPPGGVNCVMQKDEYGCCDTGYKCDEVSMSPPITGGSYPVLGGFGGSENVQHEQKLIAAVATKAFLPGVSGVTGNECDHLTLLEIVDFQRQIVAGTNFRLTLKLRAKEGPFCETIVEKTCQNIVLFRPLPYACTPSKENSHCLSLSNPEKISCS